jgi:hypothetical protein
MNMGCEVYANTNEISCKGGDNKVIASMPDVCLSPPSPPAGPVPVPYPDTSFSKDMQKGSKTVMIKGKEVMLKDQSFYKTSPLGDEAATNSFGANVVSHVITGKTYCVAWSMDVKFEGQNVDRHMDLTMSNNASVATTVAPILTAAQMNAPKNKAGKGKGTPVLCTGKHTWECDKYSCANCWPAPGCVPNAELEDKEYKEDQKKGPAERKQAHVDEDARIKAKQKADGKPVTGDPGALFERDAIDKAMGPPNNETIEKTTYWAHCSACHHQQEVDLVTNKAVKECKTGAHKLKQMKMIKSVAEACFPGKDVVCVTTAGNLADLEKTLKEKEWAPMGLKAQDP